MSFRVAHVRSQLTLIFDVLSIGASRGRLESLRQKLSTIDGVKSVQTRTTWFGSRELTIEFDPEMETTTLLRRMAGILRPMGDDATVKENDALSTGGNAAVRPDNALHLTIEDSAPVSLKLAEEMPLESAGRGGVWSQIRQFGYGILAMGSFVMSWVGLIVPGIPTVPFVILTAHFALKSSPALRKRLLRSRMFGPMISDWQKYGAIHRSTKIQASIFAIVVIAIGFAIAPQTPTLFAIMAFTGIVGLILISQIPVIKFEHDPEGESVNPPDTTLRFVPVAT